MHRPGSGSCCRCRRSETGIGHLDVAQAIGLRGGVLRHEVQTADDPGHHPARASGRIGAQHADIPEPGAGGHADDADAVVEGADRPADMGAMPLVVGVVGRVGAVGPGPHIDVWMVVEARGVEDGDVDVDPLVDAVDVRRRVLVAIDAVDARGNDPGGAVHHLVGDDGFDLRIAAHARECLIRDDRGETLEHVRIDMGRDDARSVRRDGRRRAQALVVVSSRTTM